MIVDIHSAVCNAVHFESDKVFRQLEPDKRSKESRHFTKAIWQVVPARPVEKAAPTSSQKLLLDFIISDQNSL